MTIRTYNNFIADLYADTAKNYPELCPPLKEFKESYISTYGFSEWLESLQDSKPSTQFVNSIAKTFAKHGKRTAATMPMVLAGIQRQYNIELPAVYGILTANYWEQRLWVITPAKN